MLSLRKQSPFWISGVFVGVATFPGFLLGYLPCTLNVDFREDLTRDKETRKPGPGGALAEGA